MNSSSASPEDRHGSESIAAAFHEFVNAESWAAARAVLDAHAELMTEEADSVIEALIAAETGRATHEAITELATHRRLLRQCRGYGIDAAFADIVDGSSMPDEIIALDEQLRRALGQSGQPPLADVPTARTLARKLLDHPGLLSLPDPAHATMLDLAAIALLRCYESDKSTDDLKTALGAGSKALSLTPQSSPARPGRLNNRANALGDLFLHTRDVTDLEPAFEAWEEALERLPRGSPDRPVFLNNRANRLRDRYARTGKRADIEAAFADATEAVLLEAAGPSRPRYLSDRSNVLSDRYARAGNSADLDAALADGNEGLRLTLIGDPERARRLNTRANLLLDRFELTGDSADIDAAVADADMAIVLAPPGVADRAIYLHTRSIGLSQRHNLTQNLDDLNESLALMHEVVRLTLPDDPALAGRLSNRANRLADRYAATKDPEDLTAALADSEAALALTPSESPDRPARLNNFANRVSDRYSLTETGHDLEAGVAAYREACRLGLSLQPDVAVLAAQSWATWATERRAWQEVTDAGAFGLEAADLLVRVQSLRSDKESRLRAAQGVAAQTAYAWAGLGDGRKAVIAAERGRAVLLAEATGIRGTLKRLKAGGHADLSQAYEWAATRLASFTARTRERQSQVEDEDARRHVREDFDVAAAAIRALPGFELFQKGTTTEEVAASVKEAAGDGPLVYLMAGTHGGMALTVRDRLSVDIMPLPLLTELAVSDRLNSYMDAYDSFRTNHRALRGWLTALDEATSWLWTSLGEPLVHRLQAMGIEEATLIPMGYLSLLPLHAACDTDGRPGAQPDRYLIDGLNISYAPSAQAVATARRASPSDADSILAIEEPWPNDASPLPGSPLEVAAAVASFGGRTTVLRHQHATRERVLELLSGFAVVHFSCHGIARPDEPLESLLMMAFNGKITLADVLERRLDGTELVVLSACETGLPGAELLDEVFGLPAGLLRSGAASVVSSLWSVDDLATTVLLTRFYQRWRSDGLSKGEALCDAQRWVRDLTRSERAAAFPQVDFAGSGGPGLHPYCHPYWWAAFELTGA